ncbi:MAG: CPBP family intramembrane metalloprotease [Oligoflexia bacterium]|nr:CPBP family intramembrane metalloprotease [Oligoflexia bacterium]
MKCMAPGTRETTLKAGYPCGGKMNRKYFITFLMVTIFVTTVFAEEEVFRLKSNPDKKRGVIAAPIFSLFLPGLDQYLEGQYPYAFSYTGVALAGSAFFVSESNHHRSQRSHTPRDKHEKKEQDSAKSFNSYRKLGGKIYETAGSFSAYHSFRTAVNSRRGDFSFLKHEETPSELLLAPLNFSFLARATTLLPLGVVIALSAFDLKNRDHKNRYTSIGDGIGITGGVSYMAGTGEEALFRGWLLPISHYYTNSAVWGNAISSLLFGAAHYSSSNRFPLVQAVVGSYLGYVSQKNGYALAESIFIHTWWDVVALGTLLLAKKKGEDVRVYTELLNVPF